MKKIIAVLLMLCTAVALCSCGKKEGDLGKQTVKSKDNDYVIVQEVLPFEYKVDEKTFKNNEKVKTDGFATSEENTRGKVSSKADALNVAVTEVTDKYNKVNFAFDRTRGIWKVTFSLDKEEETTTVNTTVLTVYVDEDGYTLATVNP